MLKKLNMGRPGYREIRRNQWN